MQFRPGARNFLQIRGIQNGMWRNPRRRCGEPLPLNGMPRHADKCDMWHVTGRFVLVFDECRRLLGMCMVCDLFTVDR
jgi:hypothetical protein